MKRTPQRYLTAIACFFIAVLLYSCDTFQEEVNPVIGPIEGKVISPNSPFITRLLTDEQVAEGAEVTIVSSPGMGHLTQFEKGLLLYYPNSGFNRGLDSFVYSINNGGTITRRDTVNIIVDEQQHTQCVPMAVVDSLQTLVNRPVAHQIFGNDEFCGDPMRTIGVYTPLNGDVQLSSSSTKYIPNENFTGHDQFLYYFEDKDENHIYGYVNIEVLPDSANAAPCTVRANPDKVTKTVESTMEVYVLLNDDYCHPYALSIEQAPSHGSAYFNGDGHLIYEPYDIATFTTDKLFYKLQVENQTDTASLTIIGR